MDQAFDLLRDLARAHTRRLSDLARAFVSGSDTFHLMIAGIGPDL